MPRRNDIHKVLLIGSGPIVIGQACEFDYSGTQGCKALKEEGYNVVLVNSNPATIMTDPDIADRTYIEPLTVEYLTKIIETERPDACLPTLGGQTALNLAVALSENGVFEKFGVELLGASLSAIKKAEDRSLFKDAIARLGLKVPKSVMANSLEEALKAVRLTGFPAIIRPAFTLGGSGGSIAYDQSEFSSLAEYGLRMSPIKQILIEESVLGWKEFELEVMRDKNDNVVVICSIENFDPMGIHTGDSITVAPAQTLTDKEYQLMRNAAAKIIREIGVDTGGSNIQFAINPKNGEMIVIEMNPRVSRSSALASKATGFPIAKIAAKLAIGYSLDEIPNDITRETFAAFEPTIDYVVTKIPRFSFEKFPHTKQSLGTQMKSVGEVMAIGRTFEESLLKALRSLECGWKGFDVINSASRAEIVENLKDTKPDRILWIGEALRRGVEVAEVYEITKIDPWFLHKIKKIAGETPNSREPLKSAQMLGASKRATGAYIEVREDCEFVGNDADGCFLEVPSYKTVDTCAAEFKAFTPYYYSTCGEENESCEVGRVNSATTIDGVVAKLALPGTVIILGSGPNRIGQGIEFDYTCVQASMAIRELGQESVMVNCNPETVSTDYDTSTRLYFEPLTFDDVMPIIERESPLGVIVQFGGQTPLKLAMRLKNAGVKILGTDPDDIDRAENRGRFNELVAKLNLNQPDGGAASNLSEAVAVANRVGYPVLVRPSYVLGGRAMEIVYDQSGLEFYLKYAVKAEPDHPVLVDKFLAGAIEVDVDAISDGHNVFVAGVMEHIEEAGIHSGDSSCVLPPHSLSASIIKEIKEQTEALAIALNVVGFINIQFAVYTSPEKIYILEVNPRASRTVPFVSKAIGLPLAKIATRVLLGEKLQVTSHKSQITNHYSVKTPVFPFNKFPGVDTILGPEMRSTGEVMGIGETFGSAFAKAQTAAGNPLPVNGTIFISVSDQDKPKIIDLTTAFSALGFKIVATRSTMLFLHEHGVPATGINKFLEGSPHIVDAITLGKIALVINTTKSLPSVGDSYIIRRKTLEHGVPYFTTIEGGRAAAEAIRFMQKNTISVKPLQLYF